MVQNGVIRSFVCFWGEALWRQGTLSSQRKLPWEHGKEVTQILRTVEKGETLDKSNPAATNVVGLSREFRVAVDT
jgi:hypothetical protein